MKQPIIFNYTDYRSYLSDLFLYRKQKENKFSYRFFSRVAGFSSSSFLKLVMDGKRNLTSESIQKVCKGFKLKKKESEFFRYMVQMNQASTHDGRNRYYKKMISVQKYTKVNFIAKASYDYFSKWYYPVLRELVAIDNGKNSPETLASQLVPPISAKEAKRAFSHLEKLGLIKKNEQGTWDQCQQHITTGQETKSFIVAKFHQEMLTLASEAIERFESSERDISALTLSMNPSHIQNLKEMIADFRDKVRKSVSKAPCKNQVFQINIQMFPLSQKIKKGE